MNLDPFRQTIGERLFLTGIIVLAVLAILAFIGWWAQAQPLQQPMVLLLPETKWDKKMLELDKQALDSAYVKKIEQIFDIFVREGLSTPEGPMKGHANAMRAYIYGQQALEIREKMMEERAQQK